MKKCINNLVLLSLLLFVSYSCDNDNDITGSEQDNLLTEILTDYTDKTVIATYTSMADNSILLTTALEAFEDGITDDEVVAAADAWKDTREHWEKSEAFLFGPAAFNNLDPLLDTWPLDKNQLDQVLTDVESGEIEMSAGYVRDNLGASLRGFHAVEYLLFRDGQARTGADITATEYSYLKAVALILAQDCITLESWWVGTDNLNANKQSILAEAEIETGDAFGDEIKSAGLAGSRYNTQFSAVEEIIQGAMDIADEVGNAKIADPVESKNVLDVESWYSWNSLTDFKNNIRSIENAYLGGADENNRGTSISAFVAGEDAALDTEIKTNIATALSKIDAIGEPFRNNLDNESGTSEAIAACTELFNSLQKIKNLLQ
ncbi:imelysin family protein [Maribellus maritimus]|uniref:imelysin family protein n=1 Tax=Maribellus maritimus TaxID=2870838 RepID=UPI001EEB5BE9|nr:imelysin family protein [Maribellus maritimus]MCG6186280.1 hypothetical protein [Maribellus maritimus]